MNRSTVMLRIGCALALAQIASAVTASDFVARTAKVTPAKTAEVVATGLKWSCNEHTCRASSSPGKALAATVEICGALAKAVGSIESFTMDGQALSAADLAACNGQVAKAPPLTSGVARAGGLLPPTSAAKPAPPSAPAPGGGRGPDRDGDLHNAVGAGGDDCDDRDSNTYPGANEVCDPAGKDEDCDPVTYGQKDEDGDGFFDSSCVNYVAGSRGHISSSGTDCNDNVRSIHPIAAEMCNGVDDDCDGEVDDGALRMIVWEDRDHDLFGNPSTSREICPHDLGRGWVPNDYDCDDANPRKNPAQGGC